MNPSRHSTHTEGITLRQAAIVAACSYLFNPVAYAEHVFPSLIVDGNIERTVQNLSSHSGLFLTIAFCYLLNFISDIVLAWALYVLLKPVNKSLSLLTAWFQLVYAAIGLVGTCNLFIVVHMLDSPEYLTLFGSPQLQAQISLLLHAFRYDWSISLILFGIHLILLGCLIFRSGYIPWIIGIVLFITGLGWIIDSLNSFLNATLGFTSITAYGELVFLVWLLIRGWKLQEQPRIAE